MRVFNLFSGIFALAMGMSLMAAGPLSALAWAVDGGCIFLGSLDLAVWICERTK